MSAPVRALADVLAAAHRLHQAGHLDEAEATYNALLRQHPRTPEALFRLGLLLAQRGRLSEAEARFSAALALAPGFAPLWRELAAVQLRLQRDHAALTSCARLLELRPDDAEGLNNRGAALLRLGQVEAALASFDAAVASQPRLVEARCNRGAALLRLDRAADALAAYDAVLAECPSFLPALKGRIEALERLKRSDEALAGHDAAIALEPRQARLHASRGGLLLSLQRFEEAVASFDTALALAPDDAGAACNRATALRGLGRLDAAIAGYEQAMAHAPDMIEAVINRAGILAMQGAFEAALRGFAQSRAMDPDNADGHWNEALCRLAMGDFSTGWREYEWRWRTRQLGPAWRAYEQPLWLGDGPLAGRTILLWGEQGYGDVLQFCRYASLVAARGATVVLEVPAALTRLLRTLPGPARVIATGEVPPPFDLHCPLMSLPLAFATTVETIPATTPYLRTDPDQALAWRLRLDALPGRRVGLVWAGSPRPADPASNAIDRRRSMRLAELAPLGTVPGVSFISLQKGPRAGDPPPAGLAPHDWSGELWDFADTAALVSGLDLVISVDTAVAHLAGALGKPVWVLSRYDSCWRWLRDRTDSPWYPTARLFRQRRFGAWDDVVEDVAAALARWCGSGRLQCP